MLPVRQRRIGRPRLLILGYRGYSITSGRHYLVTTFCQSTHWKKNR